MPAEVMIQCDDLTKRVGNLTAVGRVSFSVEKRSILGFLGRNGSGKTPVVHMLCGTLDPSEGRAQIARVTVGAVLSNTGRLSEAMVHLGETLRLERSDAGARASLQLGRQVLGQLQAGGAATQQ